MSFFTLQDAISIVNAIRDQVDKYHRTNAVCQEFSRVSCRFGIFLSNNAAAIQGKLGDDVINNCFKEIITVLNEIKDEISEYEGKGFIKQFFKAGKYDKRFKDLCSSLNNCQCMLQTMLVTRIAQNTYDLKEDVIDNCNDVLEKFYNEFFDTLTDGVDKIEKLKGVVELKDNEVKDLLLHIIQNQKIQFHKEQLIEKVLNSVEEIKKMTFSNQKIHGAAKLKRAFEFEAEVALENSQFTIDWNHRIGVGSFGEVFKGKMCSGQDIAVKLLPGVDDPSFRKEIGIMRRVNGLANVIYYYGYSNVINNRSYIAILTEYCPKSLKDIITDPNNGSNPNLISKWMKYCYQIASGMHSLSVLGVLHRDLKPENCLVTNDDNIVICDFGLAVSNSSFNQMSKGTASVTSQRGTVGYISKEAFEGKISEYSDVFAYGILVVYMLFCEYPWKDARGSNLRDEVIVDMIVRGKLPENVYKLTDEFFPELKPETLRVFAACCSEDPDYRPKFLQIMNVLRNPFEVLPASSSLTIVSISPLTASRVPYYKYYDFDGSGTSCSSQSDLKTFSPSKQGVVEVCMSFPKMDDSLDPSLINYYIKIDDLFFYKPDAKNSEISDKKRYEVVDNLVIFKFGIQSGAKVTVSAGIGEDHANLLKEFTSVVEVPHGNVSFCFPPFDVVSDDNLMYTIKKFNSRNVDLKHISEYLLIDEKEVPAEHTVEREEFIAKKWIEVLNKNTHVFHSSAPISDLIAAMLSSSSTEDPNYFRLYIEDKPITGSLVGDVDLSIATWLCDHSTNYCNFDKVFENIRLQRKPTTSSIPCHVMLSPRWNIGIYLEADPFDVSNSLLRQIHTKFPRFDCWKRIRLEVPEVHTPCMKIVCRPKEENPLLEFRILTNIGIYPVQAYENSLARQVLPSELLQAGYTCYPSDHGHRLNGYRLEIGDSTTIADIGITWDRCVYGMLGTKIVECVNITYGGTFVFPLSKWHTSENENVVAKRDYHPSTFYTFNLETDTVYFIKWATALREAKDEKESDFLVRHYCRFRCSGRYDWCNTNTLGDRGPGTLTSVEICLKMFHRGDSFLW